jgi:hypothetical protein
MKDLVIKLFACAVLTCGIFSVSSCAPMPTGAALSDISIGMTKDQVATAVGRGNASLCKKRTKITADGQVEVWLLYKFQMFGPANWSWNEPGTPVLVEFVNGQVTSVTG